MCYNLYDGACESLLFIASYAIAVQKWDLICYVEQIRFYLLQVQQISSVLGSAKLRSFQDETSRIFKSNCWVFIGVQNNKGKSFTAVGKESKSPGEEQD